MDEKFVRVSVDIRESYMSFVGDVAKSSRRTRKRQLEILIEEYIASMLPKEKTKKN